MSREEMPPLRAQKKQATRDRLFDSSISEFHRVGFESAKVERIVRDAGVARGTFYVHFPSKSDVLLELLHRQEKEAADKISALHEADLSLSESLLRVIQILFAERDSLEDPALFREMMAMYLRVPRAQLEVPSPVTREVVVLFVAARARGEISAERDPVELATVFLISAFGFVILQGVDAQGEPEHHPLFLETFLHGALSHTASPADSVDVRGA